MAQRLEKKLVVLTGATGLLGRHYSKELAREGAHVILSDVDQKQCAQLALEISEMGGKATAFAVNLASENSVNIWSQQILNDCGIPDVLINNAASKSPRYFAQLSDYPLEDWNHVMNVNVTGIFLTVRCLGSRMADRGHGSIINVSSIYGVVGPDQRIYEGSRYEDLGGAINTPLIYSATKGAVVAMTRYLAAYWGPRGVRVNTVTPGGVESGQNAQFVSNYSARVPLGRMATPSDMVGAMIYLASDESNYVNGHNLIVDGGLTAW